LERGQSVTEILKQKQYAPLGIAEMAVLLFAADKGYLDDIELIKIVGFSEGLLAYMHAEQEVCLEKINQKGDYNEEIANELNEAITAFKTTQTW
ncbi:MAG: synthase subunit alpha, partial [Pseudomonadota bacterium]